MGFSSNGDQGCSSGDDRLNQFALVIYIPPPLGQFLDDLRRELVPHYNPHAHVSVLPPRSLSVPWERASGQARALTECLPPFDIELTTVEVFPQTDVIYLEVGAGSAELFKLHGAMNTAALAFPEPFAYHPHITLAQEVPHELVGEYTELARRRWAEFQGPRGFRAHRAVFVQNAGNNRWVDLDEYELHPVPVG